MVMGWIWTGMVLLALGAAVLTGQTGALTAAALEGAASAIRLALGLAGALCLWSGAAKALERAGGMRALAGLPGRSSAACSRRRRRTRRPWLPDGQCRSQPAGAWQCGHAHGHRRRAPDAAALRQRPRHG